MLACGSSVELVVVLLRYVAERRMDGMYVIHNNPSGSELCSATTILPDRAYVGPRQQKAPGLAWRRGSKRIEPRGVDTGLWFGVA